MLKHKVQDRECDERLQNLDVVKCRVKIYKINMQRCPYIHEMKERLLGEQVPVEQIQPAKKPSTPPPAKMDQLQPVATVVKLNPDGFGSHTSPTHVRADMAPLMPKQPEDDFHVYHTKVYPKNAKTSLFIIMSFVYAKLLVVVCIAYVFSDSVTHNIPLYYYEGFFTYLYGMSIWFLLYVFLFLLQESSCCAGNEREPKVKPPPKQKTKEKEKELKQEEEKKKKEEKEQKKKEEKEKKEKAKKSKKPDKGPQQEGGAPPPPVPPPTAPVSEHINNVDVESGVALTQQSAQLSKCKRKTTQNDHSHGSFFLRIGAIAFGLGTMIYNGLEFGVFFEIPLNSPCYMILRGINPLLQMIFTFMQMYFIFMNSRLNIHRFKVIARFGLMHVVATNLCVWIRTLVLEYIKEITIYHRDLLNATSVVATEGSPFAERLFPASIRQHILRNANTVLGTHLAKPDVLPASVTTTARSLFAATVAATPSNVKQIISTTARTVYPYVNNIVTKSTTTTSTTTTTLPPPTIRNVFTTAKTIPTTMWRMYKSSAAPFVHATTTKPTTFAPPSTLSTLRTTAARSWHGFTTERAFSPTTATTPRTYAPSTYATFSEFFDLQGFNSLLANDAVHVADEPNLVNELSSAVLNNSSELLDNLSPQPFIGFFTRNITASSDSCGRINIMGTIVQDSAPYLFPFIIEYSLIGAAVIYCMWKHIGRNPRYVTQEDLEHRLEIMLSRRAVAMAHAQQGRVDCVGASKGLFFGLLMLVASLICLILFFVMIHHKDLGLLAIYLADVSHCVLMVLSIVAIIIGFIRVQNLKFKTEEQSDLNDILLRVSAFGLFTYAVFSVIAGHFKALTMEPNMLVMITGILSVLQVVLQLLFIADVSRRRVHLPEHDRTKPGRQVVTFLLICNITMWIIYTFEAQKVEANPVQKNFYGFLTWAIVQRLTLPLCIFHRFHSAVTLAEIWKTSYKARLE
ncbi:proton channel OtopLc isoform X12 [Dendroctonus ponderosae]|uniref:proton channel OtopLc isoform X12 n=1 Tax=Dendroctonus ponderosae TaxID=77166 RepID=UPI002035AD19|nr:proton channel OtopLc isoform X12 [Dendroctonus ponderosae]